MGSNQYAIELVTYLLVLLVYFYELIVYMLLERNAFDSIASLYQCTYIFLFNLIKYYWISKIQFFNNNMWNTKKTQFCKILRFNKIYKFCLTQFLIKLIFFILISKNRIKIQKFHYLNKICDILKIVKMENYLPKWGLHILSRTFFDKMYILCFDFKYWK